MLIFSKVLWRKTTLRDNSLQTIADQSVEPIRGISTSLSCVDIQFDKFWKEELILASLVRLLFQLIIPLQSFPSFRNSVF